MQARRWELLGDLLVELTTIAPEERESFVQAACGSDHELRAELQSLLAAHRAQGPLDSSPEFLISDSDPELPAELPGAQVGPYRLLRHIGEGGMGSVWLAERIDGVVKRAIALKRPHVSWIGTFAERTVQERDILAGLEHPNIARLYDAGVTDRGEPYLALEFIDGVPITQYCAAHHLMVRHRLQLLLQVLEAVQYAHSRLVIHRDIKPSNILISGKGRAHLLDFGIAGLLSQELSDAQSQGGGPFTPDYASPEQIRGEPIGTASDVYGMGVVSYEVLTGVRPYKLTARGGAALTSEIAHVVCPPASEAVADPNGKRSLQGDLDAILAKALQKDPTLRYAAVAAFAADIERYLASRPVLARPNRFRYRAAKWVARNRWQTASIAVAVIALIAGAAVAFWQAHQARLEAARAEQVKGFALSILESADIDSGAGAQTTAVQLLETARLRVEKELAGRPGMAAELMGAIGYGLLGQDRPVEAADVLRKAIALSSEANGPEDWRTVEAQVMYGEALYDLGKNAEAIALLRTAAKSAHRLGDAHAEIDALRWMSSVQIDVGDISAGLASARAAVQALPSPLPAGRRARQDALQAHLCLANAMNSAYVSGIAEEARAALALMSDLDGQRGTAGWWVARAYLGLGLVREGQIPSGLKELEAAYQGSKELLGPDHEETEINVSYLARSRLESGDAEGAVTAYQLAFDAVLHRNAGKESRQLAYQHYGLGNSLTAAGKPALALSHFDAAARLFAVDGGESAPLSLRARVGRVNALVHLGDLAAADREAAALERLPLAGADKTIFQARESWLRSLQGRHDEAVSLARDARTGAPLLPKARQAEVLGIIGTVLLEAGQLQEAIAPLERSDALFRELEVGASLGHEEVKAALNRARAAAHPGHDPSKR